VQRTLSLADELLFVLMRLKVIIIIIILFFSDTMVHSYIKKHTDTHRHTKTAKQLVKPVEKTDDIKKTNDYLPNMLLTSILLQRKRLHSKLHLQLCMSVLKLGKPSSKSIEVTLYVATVRLMDRQEQTKQQIDRQTHSNNMPC